MNQFKSNALLIAFCFCSLASHAGPVKLYIPFLPKMEYDKEETIQLPKGTIISPFTLTLPPEGSLTGSVFSIRLNTASPYTTIEIRNADEDVICAEILAHDAEAVAEYDLSVYGSGKYVVSVEFADGDAYEATVSTLPE